MDDAGFGEPLAEVRKPAAARAVPVQAEEGAHSHRDVGCSLRATGKAPRSGDRMRGRVPKIGGFAVAKSKS
jgi:hypothetical protein